MGGWGFTIDLQLPIFIDFSSDRNYGNVSTFVTCYIVVIRIFGSYVMHKSTEFKFYDIRALVRIFLSKSESFRPRQGLYVDNAIPGINYMSHSLA